MGVAQTGRTSGCRDDETCRQIRPKAGKGFVSVVSEGLVQMAQVQEEKVKVGVDMVNEDAEGWAPSMPSGLLRPYQTRGILLVPEADAGPHDEARIIIICFGEENRTNGTAIRTLDF